ncbi:MAG: response regulator [Phycisphaerales bacterium]|nr:response regulator [Phycisphaerales bacterium]
MPKPISSKNILRTVRLSEADVQALLDQLDAHETGASKAQRRQARFTFRLRGCVVHIQQPGDAEHKAYLAPTRDLSAKGLAFLHGGYVHVGTKVFLQLMAHRGAWTDVRGSVVHVEYVGSGVYQVGVRFDTEISPADFCEEAVAQRRRVLVVDDDPTVARLCVLLLRQLHAEAELVANGQAGVEKARSKNYDLILMDMEMPELDGFAATRLLRAGGYRGMIVAVTALDRPGDRELCLEAGCDRYIAKPYSKSDLAALLELPKREPLVSSLAGDPTISELIDAFVGDLTGRIRSIEEAYHAHDAASLERLIRNLRSEGSSYGFEPISEQAVKIQSILRDKFDVDVLEGPLHELLDLCRLVRASSPPPAKPPDSGDAPSG